MAEEDGKVADGDVGYFLLSLTGLRFIVFICFFIPLAMQNGFDLIIIAFTYALLAFFIEIHHSFLISFPLEKLMEENQLDSEFKSFVGKYYFPIPRKKDILDWKAKFIKCFHGEVVGEEEKKSSKEENVAMVEKNEKFLGGLAASYDHLIHTFSSWISGITSESTANNAINYLRDMTSQGDNNHACKPFLDTLDRCSKEDAAVSGVHQGLLKEFTDLSPDSSASAHNDNPLDEERSSPMTETGPLHHEKKAIAPDAEQNIGVENLPDLEDEDNCQITEPEKQEQEELQRLKKSLQVANETLDCYHGIILHYEESQKMWERQRDQLIEELSSANEVAGLYKRLLHNL